MSDVAVDESDRAATENELIDRYDRMIETQISTLEGIDSKAAKTVRTTVLLVGVLLTGASLLVESAGGTPASPYPLAIAGAGLAFLLFSVGFGTITYLSSVFRYGPPAALGPELAESYVEAQDYRNYVLELDSAIIDDNRTVIETNSRRFRRTLLCMLLGVTNVTAGVGTGLLPPAESMQLAVAGVTGTVNLALIAYVEREAFLTLDRQRPVTDHE